MWLKLLLLFLYCSLAIVCRGQYNPDKSKSELFKELKYDRLSDSNRQKLYNSLGKLYLPVWRKTKADLDSAFYFFRKSVYLVDSSNSNNNHVTNESLCLLAETYLRSGNLELGKRIFLQAIANYHKAGDKINEAEAWNTMGNIMAYIEPGMSYAQPCFDNALSLLSDSSYITKKITVLLGLADIHVRKGQSALAQKEVLNLLKEAKEKKAYTLADLYLFLAYLNRYKGNLTEGLTYALAAEKNLSQNTYGYNAPEIYWEIANEYQELSQPENSIYWFRKCIGEREKRNAAQYLIYRTYNLMIVQMIKVGQEKEALEILQNAEKKNPPATSSVNAILCQSLAYCFNAQSRYTLAEKYFLAMIKAYNEEVQDTEVLFIANYDISKFYVDRNQFNKAEPYLKEAFRMSNSTTIARAKDMHLLMFKIDSANGNYNKAIEQFQKYKILNDSIFNVAKNKQIEELMIKYETEKKENNIIILQKQNLFQQKSLKQAAYTRNYILTGIILLLLIVGLLYNRYRIKQQTNQSLEAKQKEIEKQNLSLLHLVSEKEWLVKEIHHRVKNNFHTVIGLLGTQSGYLRSEEAIWAMSESQQRIQAMSLIHQKLYQSENMSEIDMADYIHELVDYLKDSLNTGRKIQFHFQLEHINLGVYQAVPIGLILNETITNAIKYAFPGNRYGNIRISFTSADDNENTLLLAVADDGIGLPAGFDKSSKNSMGMNLMQGLARDIDGKFAIHCSAGTIVEIAFTYYRDISKYHSIDVKETQQV